MRPALRNIFSAFLVAAAMVPDSAAQSIPPGFSDPPAEFSVMPFWFWNDTLKDDEIIHQIAGFKEHGVYGFVIHPRLGLPENMEWLSPGMIHAMQIAIEEASKNKMYVILYDEGMYPSGSSGGQVAARNPGHAAHGLAKTDIASGEKLQLPSGGKLVALISRPAGGQVAIIEKPSGGVIRGIHYRGEEEGRLSEETPPAGDILNPDAVTSFIELVYDRYAEEFGRYFGSTILGIFTDEPSPLGRDSEKGMIPGNESLLVRINNILGYDFKPFLADLWYNDFPGSLAHRNDYYRALNICLEENYYRRLGRWCHDHGTSLLGHPGGSMDIGAERYFEIPGQDLVWRYVEPGPKALEGEHSTVAKCASGAMVHLGLRRNSNELYGAYGHNLTYEEMEWLANWCFVRGQNLLFPHAFYYSIRGPRLNERPPDVGPNASWWGDYKSYADGCRRLSWLNTDSKQVCSLAILCEAAWLPWEAAEICFTNQRDFNYLEMRHLGEDASVDARGIKLSGMEYRAIIIDSLTTIDEKAKPFLKTLAQNRRLIIRKNSQWTSEFPGAIVVGSQAELLSKIDSIITPDIVLNPSSGNIRYRHVIKGGVHFYIIFNEKSDEVLAEINTRVKGKRQWLKPKTGEALPAVENERVKFSPFEMKILMISDAR